MKLNVRRRLRASSDGEAYQKGEGGEKHGESAQDVQNSDISDVNDLLGVPAEIPARSVAEMREKRMDAGVCLLLSRLVLNLAVFYVDSVERVDGDLPELWSTSWNLETKRKIVAYIDEHNRRDDQRHRPGNSTFHRVRYPASDASLT
jgi:hypothetical protein